MSKQGNLETFYVDKNTMKPAKPLPPPSGKKTAGKGRSSSLAVVRKPMQVAPDPTRPTWDLSTPLETVFTSVPKGWADAFLDAKDELSYVLTLVAQLKEKRKGAPILPSSNALLAPFWLVPEPRAVRAIVFFDDPVVGFAPSTELPSSSETPQPPTSKSSKKMPSASAAQPRASLSKGLGPEGALEALLSRCGREASPENTDAVFPYIDGESTVQRWSRQGILCLTLNLIISSGDEPGKNTYDRMWMGFYQSMIDAVRMVNKHVPTLLMGAQNAMGMELDTGNILFSPTLSEASKGKVVQMLQRLNAVFMERDEAPIYW